MLKPTIHLPRTRGINLDTDILLVDNAHLPRTRGDKPLGFTIVADGVESTPHMRG